MGKNSDTYNTYLLKWAKLRKHNIAERKQCVQRKWYNKAQLYVGQTILVKMFNKYTIWWLV